MLFYFTYLLSEAFYDTNGVDPSWYIRNIILNLEYGSRHDLFLELVLKTN